MREHTWTHHAASNQTARNALQFCLHSTPDAVTIRAQQLVVPVGSWRVRAFAELMTPPKLRDDDCAVHKVGH